MINYSIVMRSVNANLFCLRIANPQERLADHNA